MPVEGSSLKGTNLDGALDLPEIAGAAINVTGRYGSSIATSFPDSSGGPRLAPQREVAAAWDKRATEANVSAIRRWPAGLGWNPSALKSSSVAAGRLR